MEPLFLKDIILILPGNNKQRTFMQRDTMYFKDIFTPDAMESTKPGSPLKTTLYEFFQIEVIFFSSEQPCWLFEDLHEEHSFMQLLRVVSI